MHPEIDLFGTTQYGDRGIFARGDIQHGERLFLLPTPLCMHVPNLVAEVIPGILHVRACGGIYMAGMSTWRRLPAGLESEAGLAGLTRWQPAPGPPSPRETLWWRPCRATRTPSWRPPCFSWRKRARWEWGKGGRAVTGRAANGRGACGVQGHRRPYWNVAGCTSRAGRPLGTACVAGPGTQQASIAARSATVPCRALPRRSTRTFRACRPRTTASFPGPRTSLQTCAARVRGVGRRHVRPAGPCLIQITAAGGRGQVTRAQAPPDSCRH